MGLNRTANNMARAFLEDWLPPAIRDSHWFGSLLQRMVYGDQRDMLIAFRERSLAWTPEDFKKFYSEIQIPKSLQRETDCSPQTVDRILRDTVDVHSVVDVGCGSGYLCRRLQAHSQSRKVVGLDYKAGKTSNGDNVIYQQYDGIPIPFEDNSFDAVVSTHTVEHVQDVREFIGELRRVARDQLIIVVPRERPTLYQLNAHLSHWAYTFDFVRATGVTKLDNVHHECYSIQRDIYYRERYHE